MLFLKNPKHVCFLFKWKTLIEKCIVSSSLNFQKQFLSSFKYEDIKIKEVSLNNYIKQLEKEYESLSNDKQPNASKRFIKLHSAMEILTNRKHVVGNLHNLKELLVETDNEIRKMAEEEKKELENELIKLDKMLLDVILPLNDENDYDSIVLEVQAGVGGQEAMLFAKEIFDMYCNFAAYKGWTLQIAEFINTELGGIRHASALINGHSAFQYFKYEAGIHRVQRTPSTEKSGRIHTSTISVVALPQLADVEVKMNPKDLLIETKRSSGAGGQHVNTTDSCVRILHIPTRIAVECQVERSQIQNKKIAMARLGALLYQKELDTQIAQTEAVRKNQVRTRNRNEKIRTYNFNQDRITDHRLQGLHMHNLETFLEGGEHLNNLIENLENQDRLNNLLTIVNNIK